MRALSWTCQINHNLLLGQPGTVIAFDQQGDTAVFIDVSRPVQCLVESVKLLVEVAILLQRGVPQSHAARSRRDRSLVDLLLERRCILFKI